MKTKRTIALVLAVLMILGCAACTPKIPEHDHDFQETSRVEGTCKDHGVITYTCTICGETTTEELPIGTHHSSMDTPENDDYITYLTCDTCGIKYMRPSNRIYDEDFKFTLDEERIAASNEVYQTLMDYVAAADAYDASKHTFVKDSDQYNKNKDFEHTYYDPFVDELEYAIEQYQYANVLLSVNNGSSKYQTDFDTASEFYNDMIEKYYVAFRPIYETEYRDYFYSEEDGWTPEDIQRVLETSDTYSDGRCTEINKRIDEITNDYRALRNPSSDRKVRVFFEELVELNNELARIFGYDNYMDYAYENVYERSYSREETHKMRNFVKQYLANDQIIYAYYASEEGSKYSYLVGSNATSSIFTSEDAMNLVADFLRTIKSDSSANELDFVKTFNELLKNGNYFTGRDEKAFTYYFSTQDMAYLYFGPKYYSSCSTFVHEFGHYMNSVYNGGIDLSMDHDETQSQGNEFMFLAYVHELCKSRDEESSFKPIYAGSLYDALSTILLSCAVDEFEEIVYTGYYDGNNATILDILSDGVVGNMEFDTLFEAVSEAYGLNKIYNPVYWRYVVIEAPCYYISYAMSQIPVLTLYAKYEDEGYEAAVDSYLKLFNFTDLPEMAHRNEEGDLECDVDYIDVLKYAGLTDAFTEETYKNIAEMYEEVK